VLSLLVAVIFIVTGFAEGAWVIVVLIALILWALARLNRGYRAQRAALRTGAAQAATSSTLPHHTVLVFIDGLNMASARAIQHARTINPDEIRAIHFVVEAQHALGLQRDWAHLATSVPPLELIECPDRSLIRSAVALAAHTVTDGKTEASIVLSRSEDPTIGNRLVDDHTADRIAEAVEGLDHVSATVILFPVRGYRGGRTPRQGQLDRPKFRQFYSNLPAGAVPIRQISPRQRATVAGRVRSVQIQPRSGIPVLGLTMVDTSGDTLQVTFLGRRHITGIQPGVSLSVQGMVGSKSGQLSMLNPLYEILVYAPEAA
jgi:hypothetical protein